LIDKKGIVEYYDVAQVSYQDVWHLDDCLALHYGFWESGVTSLRQALVKENEVLAQLAGIQRGDAILDAGCGVGGSSIYLAKTIGCSVTGITLSDQQVDKAQEFASKNGVEELCNFQAVDFHETPFADESFDVIWFTESFCHSTEPKRLLSEMYRLLKPGGRIIIADGFLAKENNASKDAKLLSNWLNNWAVNSIGYTPAIKKHMDEIGFLNIEIQDYSAKIAKSAKLLYRYALSAIFIRKFWGLFGKNYGNEITIKNTYGANYQYQAFKKRLWKYEVILGRKK
tara:strand:+ start:24414 stop:25265 length:852 start_codon:yes stop_codon:yes gene_type:complete